MKKIICTVCPRGCHLSVDEENNYTTFGNDCPRGAEYAKMEVKNPVRIITSTVKCTGGVYSRLPVKTNKPIPKQYIFAAVKLLDNIEIATPVCINQIIIKNICATNADFVAARNMNTK